MYQEVDTTIFQIAIFFSYETLLCQQIIKEIHNAHALPSNQ